MRELALADLSELIGVVTQVVQQALPLMRGRTTIATAHRLSTTRHADVIFVLATGLVLKTATA